MEKEKEKEEKEEDLSEKRCKNLLIKYMILEIVMYILIFGLISFGVLFMDNRNNKNIQELIDVIDTKIDIKFNDMIISHLEKYVPKELYPNKPDIHSCRTKPEVLLTEPAAPFKKEKFFMGFDDFLFFNNHNYNGNAYWRYDTKKRVWKATNSINS